MSFKTFFRSKKLTRFSHELHERAQTFFEPTASVKNYATIPENQLKLFLNQAIQTKRLVTITLKTQSNSYEKLTGTLYPLNDQLKVVYLRLDAKKIRLIFIKDIVHLDLGKLSLKDVRPLTYERVSFH